MSVGVLSALVSLVSIAMSGAPAFAEERLTVAEAAVVKVYSFQCNNQRSDFRGSGTLFKRSADDHSLYVLTSEHVLLSGNEADANVCHKVSYQSRGGASDGTWLDAKAELIATDWQSGLALLKLSDPQSIDLETIQTYRELIATVPTKPEINVVGLPYGSTDGLVRSVGTLVAEQSFRHLMPNKAPVFEVDRAAGEFGMSGGPAFDTDGKFVGLLSHQFIVTRPGGAAGVGVVSEGSQASQDNRLLLIRGTDVVNWLDRALGSDFQPGFVRSVTDQLKGREVVYVGNLKFSAQPVDRECTTSKPVQSQPGTAPVGGDPVGIGGDPVGIGGGDPVGIGGVGQSLPKSIAISVEWDRNPPAFARTSRWNIARLEPWFVKLKDAVLTSDSPEISAIVYREPNAPEKGLSRICVRSLEEFFRKLVADGSEAVTYRKKLTSSDPGNRAVADLLKEGAKLFKSSDDLYADDSFKKLNLVQYGRMYGSLLSSAENWNLVRLQDLASLRCARSDCAYYTEWKLLLGDRESRDRAQELMNSLTYACKALKVLTVDGGQTCD
jgi:hypothetical protein